jgi:hypothetical protein
MVVAWPALGVAIMQTVIGNTESRTVSTAILADHQAKSVMLGDAVFL